MKIQTKLIVTLIAVTFLIALAGSLTIYQLGHISQTVNRLPESIQSVDEASKGSARFLISSA